MTTKGGTTSVHCPLQNHTAISQLERKHTRQDTSPSNLNNAKCTSTNCISCFQKHHVYVGSNSLHLQRASKPQIIDPASKCEADEKTKGIYKQNFCACVYIIGLNAVGPSLAHVLRFEN